MPAVSWTTIARKRHTLTRHPDVLEAYQDFKMRLAAQGLTLEDHVRATVMAGARGPVLAPNAFPYWVAPGIQHWVLWSGRGPLSTREIREAIAVQRPAGVTRAQWFENPPAAKTVPGIWHVHVFLSR
jgi:hypothetical protein